MNNADLAIEFLKKCQECKSKGVPQDMAVLAALQDIADYKDKQYEQKSVIAHVNTYENVGEESYVEFVVEGSTTKYKEKDNVRIVVLDKKDEKAEEEQETKTFPQKKTMSELPNAIADKLYSMRLRQYEHHDKEKYISMYDLIDFNGTLYCSEDKSIREIVTEYILTKNEFRFEQFADAIFIDGIIFKNRYGYCEF